MSKLIDGKKIAEKILLDVRKKVIKLKNTPGLAAIMIGDNPASKLYLKLKEKACLEAGLNFSSYQFPINSQEEQIIEAIKFLNTDPDTTGILVQLPLPPKFNADKIIQAIDPKKDIDGFLPKSRFISPTALGIVELLKETKVKLKNKKVAIISNSEKFATPFKKLLSGSRIKHLNPQSVLRNLQSAIKEADILIVAIGKPRFIKPSMIKKGAILIDVGINKVRGKTVGDIDLACDKIASWRSPVPGGVGPMTVAMLLQNLVSVVK